MLHYFHRFSESVICIGVLPLATEFAEMDSQSGEQKPDQMRRLFSTITQNQQVAVQPLPRPHNVVRDLSVHSVQDDVVAFSLRFIALRAVAVDVLFVLIAL